MSASDVCMKVILILFNTIVSLVGLVLLAAGVLLKVNSSLLEAALEQVVDAIPQLSSSLLNSTSTSQESAIDVDKLLAEGSIIVIAIGAVLFIVGILGCCGACCSCFKFCLVVYGIIILLLALAELGCAVVFFVGKFDSFIEDAGRKQIEKSYGGLDDFGPFSTTLNVLMLELECCGWKNYTDFYAASKWNRQRTINNASRTLVTPIACCNMTGTFPNVQPVDEKCSWTLDETINNYKDGCFEKIREEVKAYFMIAIIIIAVAIVVQFMLAIFAFCIHHRSSEDD